MKAKLNLILLFLGILFLPQSVLLDPVMAESTRIFAAGDHSFVLKSDGSLWAWGANRYGQLGDGTTTDKQSPIQIGANKDWVLISTGYNYVQGSPYTLALKADGSLWGWGRNDYGQLGDGTTTNKQSPVQIGTNRDWVLITAGPSHTLALKSDKTLWAWGLNNAGQLGDGTTENKKSPVQIGTDKDWVLIMAGQAHSIGLKSNGTLWAWGGNTFGQLGDGTIEERHSPKQTGTENKWVSIAAGSRHVFALKADGTLWGWGNNRYGQLGDGTTEGKSSPIQIGIDKNWSSVVTSDFNHTLAQKKDGSLWGWGRNPNGQLGDATTEKRPSSVQIGTDKDWVSIAVGQAHSIGLKSNRTLWAWGSNTYGQLGDGTTVNKNTPVQIGDKW